MVGGCRWVLGAAPRLGAAAPAAAQKRPLLSLLQQGACSLPRVYGAASCSPFTLPCPFKYASSNSPLLLDALLPSVSCCHVALSPAQYSLPTFRAPRRRFAPGVAACTTLFYRSVNWLFSS